MHLLDKVDEDLEAFRPLCKTAVSEAFISQATQRILDIVWINCEDPFDAVTREV